MKKSLVALAFLALACATSNVPRTNSRTDLQTYVEQAAAIIRDQGPAACSTFSRREWMDGDYYIFVNNADTNVTVCQPVRPEMVGQDQSNLQDPTGKYIIREMLAAATGPEGRGWVEYMWPRPGQTDPSKKIAYVVSVNGPDGVKYVVGSGYYEMPR